MLSRYFIFMSFKGTAYHGWQVQPGAITVQEILCKSLSTLLREDISLTGAGRTDSGVHAIKICAHFDSRRNDLHVKKNLLTRINKYLPPDIAVTDIRMVKNDANARYSALSRTYRYCLITEKDPFRTDTAWYLNYVPDIGLMNEACSILMRYNDFTSFARLHSNAKTNICRIYEAYWEQEDKSVINFTITADRFLRNMVRAIVGTMVDVGRGKTSLAEFREIIEEKNRCSAGKSAPASGLFLTDIRYPEDIFI